MNKIEIKIVGSIPDEDTLDEIQNIAKIFVYEQRMKHFNYPTKNNNPIRKKPIKFYKKIDNRHKIITNHLPHNMVRGLM